MSAKKAVPESAPGGSAYLVLGMHRSGTSAVTQLLALAGAKLPSHVMPGDEHNAKGYFEPWRIAIFNDERLRAAGSAWDDPFTDPDCEPEDSSDWRDRAIKLFRSEYRKARAPLLKDPRVSVLLPLWRQVLEAEGLRAQCVIPVRHPLAVAGSLAKRDGFPTVKSLLLWMTYMVETEAGSRDLPRAFVEYDALLADWRPVVQAMEATLGAPLPDLNSKAAAAIDDFLTPDLRHNKADESLEAYGQIGQAAQGVLDWLLASARGGAPDLAPMVHARNLIRTMGREIGPLVSPVTRSNNQAQADLAEARNALAAARGQAEELQARSDQYNAMNQQLGALVESLTAQVKDLEKLVIKETKRSAKITRAAEAASNAAREAAQQAQGEIESLTRQLLERIEERRQVEGALDELLAAR